MILLKNKLLNLFFLKAFNCWVRKKNLPAAKCRGVDFLPAVSRAFTDCCVTNFFTLIRFPVLHASNNSRNGSLELVKDSEDVDKADLRLDISLHHFIYDLVPRAIATNHCGEIGRARRVRRRNAL